MLFCCILPWVQNIPSNTNWLFQFIIWLFIWNVFCYSPNYLQLQDQKAENFSLASHWKLKNYLYKSNLCLLKQVSVYLLLGMTPGFFFSILMTTLLWTCSLTTGLCGSLLFHSSTAQVMIQLFLMTGWNCMPKGNGAQTWLMRVLTNSVSLFQNISLCLCRAQMKYHRLAPAK